MALDLELVRPDVDRGVARLGVRVLGVRDLEPGHDRLAALDAPVEHVDVAEEVHDERVRRMLEDLRRRADLLDLPWFMTTTWSATSKASS